MSKLVTLEEWAKRRYERLDALKKMRRSRNPQYRRVAGIQLALPYAYLRVSRGRAACPVMPLDQLRGLPRATERSKRCAVYFLWRGPVLYYVGQSISVGIRLAAHRCAGRVFTHATILTTRHDCLRETEKRFIAAYLPRWNGTL